MLFRSLIAFGVASRADVDTIAERLIAAGVQIDRDPTDLQTPGGGYGVRFFDPDGRLIEVSADVATKEARALEPRDGVDIMRARRGRAVDVMGLCRGPGNLTVALGITLDQNRADLTRGPLTIEDHGLPRRPIRHTPRIGIRVGTTVRWRALAVDSLAVTKIKG